MREIAMLIPCNAAKIRLRANRNYGEIGKWLVRWLLLLCAVLTQRPFPAISQGHHGPMTRLSGGVYYHNSTQPVQDAHVECYVNTTAECLNKNGIAWIQTDDSGRFEIQVPLELRTVEFRVSTINNGHVKQLGIATYDIPSQKSAYEIPWVKNNPQMQLEARLSHGSPATIGGRLPPAKPAANGPIIMMVSLPLYTPAPRRRTLAVVDKPAPETVKLPGCVFGPDPKNLTVYLTSAAAESPAQRLDVNAKGCYTAQGLSTETDYLVSVRAEGYVSETFVLRFSLDAYPPYYRYTTFRLSASSNGEPEEIKEVQSLNVTLKKPDEKSGQGNRLESLDIMRGETLLGSFAESLPIPEWRSPDYLAFLLPGVAPPPQPIGPIIPGVTPGIGSAGQFSVNGLRSRDNTFTDDGADNNDEETGLRRQGILASFPQPIESIEAVRLGTSLGDASYGRGIAGQIDVFSRAGGSAYHGQLWGFGAGGPFRAADAFNVKATAYPAGPLRTQLPITDNGLLSGADVGFTNDAGTSLPATQPNPAEQNDQFSRFQTGFVMDGPLPGKGSSASTHFTISGERRIVHQLEKLNFAAPTADDRQVCPSATNGNPSVPMDACIQGSQMSTALYPDSIRGDALWSLYPFPNNPLGPYGGNTLTQALSGDGSANVYMGRLDRAFDFKALTNLLGIRYNASDESSILPATDDAISSSVKPIIRTRNAALFLETGTQRSTWNAVRLSYGVTSSRFNDPDPTHAGAPFMLNAPLLMNVTLPGMSAPQFVSANSGPGSTLLSNNSDAICRFFTSGCNGIVPTSTNQVDTARLGALSVGGYSSVGVTAGNFPTSGNFPESRFNSTWEFADAVSALLGTHIVSFGFDIRWLRLDSTTGPGRPLGDYHGLYNAGTCVYGASPPCPFPAVVGQPPKLSPNGLTQANIMSPASMVSAGVPAAVFQTYAIVPSGTTPDYTLKLGTVPMDFFFQDEFPLPGHPNLHLNLGFHIQDAHIPQDQSGYFAQAYNGLFNGQSIIPGGSSECSEDDLVAVLCALLPTSLQHALNSNPFGFDPRVGFVWDPRMDGKILIHAGWGRYTGQFPAVLVDEARNVFPNFLNVSGAVNTNASTLQSSTIVLPAGEGPIQALMQFVPDEGTNSLSANLVYPGYPLRNPYSMQQNLTIETRLRDDLVFTVAYVGSEGRHLLNASTPQGGLSRSWVNYAIDSAGTAEIPGNGGSTGGTPSPPSMSPSPFIYNFGCTSFAQIPVGGVNACTSSGTVGWAINSLIFGSGASSSYNSLQATVEWRGRKGIQATSAFTWSHTIDNVSDFAPLAGAFALPQDSFHPSERGSSNFDMRLRSVTEFVADSSQLFSDLSGYRRWLRSLEFSGILTLQSGQPYTINTSVDVNMDGNATDRLGNTDSPYFYQVHSPRTKVVAPEMTRNDLLASPGQDGAIGRNTFVGWGLYNLDLALGRSFAVPKAKDRVRLALRAEVYNLFNHPDFGIPDRILESPGFGSAVATITPPRTAQAMVKLVF
jgi:hypothetical protein